MARSNRSLSLVPGLVLSAGMLVAPGSGLLAQKSPSPVPAPAPLAPPSNVLGGCTPGTPVTFSFTGPPVSIPDGLDLSGTMPGAPVVANIPVAAVSGPIFDVDLSIDGSACNTTVGSTTVGIDHSFVNDLELTLISPNSTQVVVVDNTDGSGNNICQTVLDDESGGANIQTALTANAPFSGSWVPNAALAAFDGEDPNGTWMLQAQDFFSQDTGSIRAYSVTITPAICPEADLAIQKVGVTQPGAITYTITVTNNGPDTANNVVVTDTLPAELLYVSDDCGGSNTPPWTWNVGALANGGSAVCNITMDVVTPGAVVNVASVSADEPDPTAVNDSATATNTVTGSAPAVIPTVNGVGVALLMVLLAGASVVFLRRRRQGRA